MTIKKITKYTLFIFSLTSTAFADKAAFHWFSPKVSNEIKENILYLPISDSSVKSIKLEAINEELIDLLKENNPRIKPLSSFNSQYKNTYAGYSKVRLGLYKRLVKMLEFLPSNVGIAYFEGLRPLSKQKEYFDKKFKEILVEVGDKEKAYYEAAKSVSPFIDNIPPHATGAAIDMTLFSINDKNEELLDMGKFDNIIGHNNQQETFSSDTTKEQRDNRLVLLDAAAKAGLVNYGFKWSHYSYGDKMWAYVKKQKTAIYGLAIDANDPILLIKKDNYLKSFTK